MIETRTCRDCLVVKPVSAFHKKRVGANVIQQYQSYCKDCQQLRYNGHRTPVGEREAPRTKVCPECAIEKLVSAYATRKTGRQAGQPEAYCKDCQRARKVNWARQNPERMRELAAASYKRRGRATRLAAKYGLTPEAFQGLLDQQESTCRGCSRDFGESLAPRVDHCHTDQHVRGLLCHSCNVVLGLVKDDPLTLRRLATYVEETRHDDSPRPEVC